MINSADHRSRIRKRRERDRQKLAERLGWKLWDQLLTNEVARHSGMRFPTVEQHEERRDPLYYRLFKAFLRGSLRRQPNAHRMKMADADCMREASEKLVRQAAREGNCVIVGRGSAYYLETNPDAFHVFIYAPFEEKIQRLRNTGKSEEEAHVLAETVDQDRTAYIKQYFNIEWPFREFYRLMINSSLGDEVVVDTILSTVGSVDRSLARR